MLAALPSDWVPTRTDLHRVAVHVLARRRHDLVRRIGLRATPGGIGTPAAGPDHESLRLAGGWLVRERTGGHSRAELLHLRGTTLTGAAAFAEVDLAAPFDAGHDTPPVGDADAPLTVGDAAASALAGWFAFGWHALDATVATRGEAGAASVVQIWPEHFDAACDVAVGAGEGARVNLGASPGDGFEPGPYLYVGPWQPDRPGDSGFWNAPFGAVLRHADLLGADDPLATGVAFFERGVELLSSVAR